MLNILSGESENNILRYLIVLESNLPLTALTNVILSKSKLYFDSIFNFSSLSSVNNLGVNPLNFIN